jgi:hypothetical protein
MLKFAGVTGRLAPYRFYLNAKVGGIGVSSRPMMDDADDKS